MYADKDVIIIGGGLSGLTTAKGLTLAGLSVELLEQGKRYENRQDSNSAETLVGLGGSGTLSGGKLCFPPASGGIWTKTAENMEQFREFYREMFSDVERLVPLPIVTGDWFAGMIELKKYRTEVILRKAMQKLVTNLVNDISQNGAVVRSGCRVDKVERSGANWKIWFKNESGEIEWRYAKYVVFATGRTSVRFLANFFGEINQPMPDLGIRITVDAKQPAFSMVGQDVKLKRVIGNQKVRTFCVCRGGGSIKTSTQGLVHYDGHFLDHITNQTNLGILARSKRYSGFDATNQYLTAMQIYVDAELSLKDFCKYRSVLAKGTPYIELFDSIAQFVSELYDGGLLVQNIDEIPVMLPSVDHVNPIIYTNSGFESRYPNIYVIGDAAGISRGFVQAMWSGKCASERIIEQCTGFVNRIEAV